MSRARNPRFVVYEKSTPYCYIIDSAIVQYVIAIASRQSGFQWPVTKVNHLILLLNIDCFTNSVCKILLLNLHVKSSMISVLFELPVDRKTKHVWRQLLMNSVRLHSLLKDFKLVIVTKVGGILFLSIAGRFASPTSSGYYTNPQWK